MTKGAQSLLLLVVAAAVMVGLTLWRMGLMTFPRPETPAVFVPEPPAVAPEPEPAPAVKHPLAARHVQLPPTAMEIGRALVDLLGRDAVATFLQTEEFPRRLAATIDNLGRAHAPRLLWPVQPAPDRFTIDEVAGGPVIGLENSARYTPFVLMAEAIDTRRAADLYVRMYPLLQRAYEDLGFPGRYFNDRVIAVIDLLLATPEAEYPLELQLTEVKGPIAPERPWVLYEFADPALESLAAGQKILLRVGPVNQRRLKAKLADIRAELIRRAPRR